MEELFRFSVIRPATRAAAYNTIELESNPIRYLRLPVSPTAIALPIGGRRIGYVTGRVRQALSPAENALPPTQQLFALLRADIISGLTAVPPLDPEIIWAWMMDDAFDYLLVYSPDILTAPLWSDLQKFLSDLQQALASWSSRTNPNKISKLVSDLVTTYGSDAIASYRLDLSGLFIALMVMRRPGPAFLLEALRRISLHEPALQVWQTCSALVTGSPTLKDVADRIRLANLLETGAAALLPPPTVVPADVQAYIQSALDAAMNSTLLLPTGMFTPLQKPIHGAGFREFHVVKQHIRGYQLGEIANIENILAGESRSHSTTHTLSNETDTFNQTVSSTETDKELTNTDKVDIKNESANQVKTDTKVDAGVHAQYDGGSFHLQADLTVAYDKSTDDSKKFASDVGKETTQKATSKVSQQVTQSQTTKIIETFQDTESRTFQNSTGTNISGVYRWVEKVYLAQTFSLGKHMLFDIMVPEPAGNFIGLMTNHEKLPIGPDPLMANAGTNLPISPGDPGGPGIPLRPDLLNEVNVEAWVAKYRVTGVDARPAPTVSVTTAIVADGRNDPQKDVKAEKDLQIPDGYAAKTIYIAANWFATADRSNPGDEQVDISVSGGNTYHFQLNNCDSIIDGVGSAGGFSEVQRWGQNYAATLINSGLANDESLQGQFSISVKTINLDQLSVNFEIICFATLQTVQEWQFKTYSQIVTAWQALEQAYQAVLASQKIEGTDTGPLGSTDPNANRMTERLELKRSCIAILSSNNETVRGVGNFSGAATGPFPPLPVPATDPGYPQLPEPNLTAAQIVGAKVRWYEQAFEWENIAYIFYPYFWGRRSTWLTNQNLATNDPMFANFLQSGFARVVVPVRNSFRWSALLHLHLGLPWLGDEVPPIGDMAQHPLYLDIAEEIKANTGGGEPNEIETPLDEIWQIKLPTALLQLQPDGSLPGWDRLKPEPAPAVPDLYASDPAIGPWTWEESASPAKPPIDVTS